MKILKFVTLFAVFYSELSIGVTAVSVEVDLRMTPEQKRVMNKFKKIMIPKLAHKYMHEEIYLVRWLRARNFDVKKAEEMLLQNLKWRKQTKMDTIHQENWSDMQHEFPYYIDGLDKQGRPVITAIVKDWDIRNAVVTGRIRRALRFMDKGMDEAYHILRKFQSEGKNVTQFSIVVHMGNFNLYQHGCPRCVTGILEFVDSYEKHFPGMADKILLVQTPPVYEAIGLLVKEASSPLTRQAMKIYGTNPKVWKKALLDFIDVSQLTPDFGGTKPEKSVHIGGSAFNITGITH